MRSISMKWELGRSKRKPSVSRCCPKTAQECEFATISYWESIEAMSRFAGKDPRRIHHLERDAEFLIELPKEVQILNIVASHRS